MRIPRLARSRSRSSLRCIPLARTTDAVPDVRGDNERMTEATIGTARGRLSAVLAFAKSAESRPRPSGRAIAWDILLAVALAAASFYMVRFHIHGAIWALLAGGPLPVRRGVPRAPAPVLRAPGPAAGEC